MEAEEEIDAVVAVYGDDVLSDEAGDGGERALLVR